MPVGIAVCTFFFFLVRELPKVTIEHIVCGLREASPNPSSGGFALLSKWPGWMDGENEFTDGCLTDVSFVCQYCGCQIYCDAEVSWVTLQKALKPKKSVHGSEKWLLSISLVISSHNNLHISNHLIIYRSISLVNALISALTFPYSSCDWELFSL